MMLNGDRFDLKKSFNITAPWARFEGEFHIPGYNFVGPGIKMVGYRLDENMQPLSDAIPIRQVHNAVMNNCLDIHLQKNKMIQPQPEMMIIY